MTIHHDGSARYVPNQSPRIGDVVDVYARASGTAGVGEVWLRATQDGGVRFLPATVEPVPGAEPGVVWFRAPLPVHNRVTRYRFLLAGAGGYRWLTAAGIRAGHIPDDTDFRLVCGDGPPAWSADAIGYLIFPDRFARSAGADRRPVPDWALVRRWDAPVNGAAPDCEREFFGGDLDGIREHLDHVAALSADTICLTPFFASPTNHRYRASSFERVDPALGGEEAFTRLAGALHGRGWRLIGDLTTNHTGAEHEWFQRARAGAHRDLYYFDDRVEHGYETWANVEHLPKLNWGSRELRRRFFDGPDSVARRWLAAGLDGWRVDVGHRTGRRGADDDNHEVAAAMLAAVRASRPDALLIAEHMHDASGDIDIGGWHGVLNYAGFSRPVWSWLGAEPLSCLGLPVGVPRLSAASMVKSMRAFAARMSWRTLTTSWSLLDSHDTPRIRTVVGDDAALVEVAAGLMATLPGTPMVYAGSEIGLRGRWAEDGRRPIPWQDRESWDRVTLTRYRSLLGLRRENAALRRGGLRFLHAGEHELVYLRETADERLLVYAARQRPAHPVGLTEPADGENIYGGAPDLRSGRPLPADGPTFQVWRLREGGGRGRGH
ncbi:MAG TPA: glycoside hydrolase family 13 protein [Rugosimonospora sp.]|nr:glycoside hydrolase family 13 protein [Rugosimonospora sp.]